MKQQLMNQRLTAKDTISYLESLHNEKQWAVQIAANYFNICAVWFLVSTLPMASTITPFSSIT